MKYGLFYISFMVLLVLATVGCQPTQTIPLQHSSVLKLARDLDATLSLEMLELLELAKTDHVALFEQGLAYYASVPVCDYTCTFVKQEKLHGYLGREQNVDVKFRAKPFSVAMIWTKNAPLADRLIYVAGRYEDPQGRSRMLVRPKGGLAQFLAGPSVLKLPDGPEAMRNTLRPCTQFGFRNTLNSLLDVYRTAIDNEDCTMRYDGITQVGGRKCLVLTRLLPPKKGYPAYLTEICLDIETRLPLRIVGYDWRDNLLCNYEYHNVDFNVALTDKDFSPQANGIEPPKR